MSTAASSPGTLFERLSATPRFERLLAPALTLLLGLILVFADTRVYRDVLYAVVIPLALLAAPRLRPGVVLRSPLWWLAVAYAAYFALALPFVGRPDLHELYDVVRRLLAIMLFVAIVVCLRARNPALDRRLFGCLGSVAAVAGLYAVGAFYAAHPLDLRIAPVPALVPQSTDSPIANPNISGCLAAVIGLGLLHHRVLAAPRSAQALLWALPLAALALFIAGTASRAVFAGLAAALLATAVVRRALRPLAAAAVLA
ncbi:MAG: hypothetical protein IRY94_15610, partial [Rhodospirillaceae bacterium]|nr:hypothetical protein [Rhodospirillaceae bacterium]